MTRRMGASIGAVTAAALLASCGAGAPSVASGPVTGSPDVRAVATAAPHASALASLTVGRPAWVAVSLATVWRSRTSPRPVDAPALGRPARIRDWLASMTLSQRRGLGGRADTQALMGERVVVVRLRPGWARVVVPDQPSPKDRRGYPGWVPRRQLTARHPVRTASVATVIHRTAWLRSDSAAASRVVEISFGTELPVVGAAGRATRVMTPLGVVRRIRDTSTVTHARGTPALSPTPRSLVATARLFTGLPYLWAGVSGFGLDCSGLTWLVHRSHGIVISRDADAQASHGAAVAWSALRKGDLMFYATDGVVHHVTMYAGSGTMVQSPHTGGRVETVPVTKVEYAGARRYLP